MGIFGHTTVFHSQTNSLYVFGGYAYDKDTSIMSNSLYRFEYETKSWIELTSSNSVNVASAQVVISPILFYPGCFNYSQGPDFFIRRLPLITTC